MTRGESPKPDLAYRVLAHEIRDEIRRGRYAPGQRIPTVREFIEQGHSSTTVKAAFAWLKDEGWVRTLGTRGGTVVADALPDVRPTLEERVAALEAWVAEQDRRE